MFHDVLLAYARLFEGISTGPLCDIKRIIVWGFPNYPIWNKDLPALQLRLGQCTKYQSRQNNILFYQEVFIHVIYNFETFKSGYSYDGRILSLDVSSDLSDKIGAQIPCADITNQRTAFEEWTVLGILLDPANLNIMDGEVVGIFDDTQGIDVSFQNTVRWGFGSEYPTWEGIVRFVVMLSSRKCY